jgi:hypothetical protein
MALGRKTGGRKKGPRDRRPRELIERIEASDLTPLQYMLSVMCDETQPAQRRDQMARVAAPYMLWLIDALGKSVLFEMAKR